MAPELPGKGSLVLVVEDDENVRQMLADLLQLNGFRVAAVSDGLEALKHLARGEEPAAIILDLMMPGVSGVRFLELRAINPKLPQIPVIVATGSGIDAAGFDVVAVFAKPLDVNAVLTT